MKLSLSCLRLVTFLSILFLPWLVKAQGNTWVAKAAFGGTARQFATGFSIGTKVYLGTGTSDNGTSGLNDFWEYNTTNNTWMQKANFGGSARYGAVGFTINGKGYIALGSSDGTTLFKDIWEYDPTGNTWTQRADMSGAARIGAVAFVVNNKAYVGTGQSASGSLQDLWEFDPAVGAGGTWTSKTNFPGVARSFATGFAIGTKGYLGTGSDTNDNSLADFWEYNPAGNAWTQKANFGGGARASAVGFSIDPKGYIATGADASPVNDCWKYDPSNNTWTQTTNVVTNARTNAVGISLGSKGYIGTGVEIDNATNGVTKNFFEYLALTDQTITFNALAGKTFGDGTFSLSATASSTLTVSFVSSNTSVATISGTIVTIVGAGTTTITASQAGNATYAAAPSVDQTLTVAKANQTITFNALTGKTFGNAPFGLGATTTSPLTVSYSSSNTSVATVSGSTVTIVGAGTTTITASQAGNGNYNAATAVDQTLSVAKANQTITFGALAGKSVGDAPFSLGATTTSLLTISYSSSNTGVATISGSTVTIVGEGTTTITASQAGNANFNAAADAPQSLVVTDLRATQTITFGALSAKTYGDAVFSVTPTASSSLTVVVTSSNTSVATVNGSNQVTIVGAGTTTLTASQAGNASFKPATSVDQTLTVAKANQTPFFYIPPTATVGMGIGIGPYTSASLPVTVTSSNTAVATVAPAAGGSWFFSVIGAGTTTVTITQAGNSNYNAVTQTGDMVVSKANQTITFSALPAKTYGDLPFGLTAYSSVNLSVAFASSDPAIAEINSATNIVTIKKAGTVQITANQSGSNNYNAATPVVRDLVINKANQTITFSALEDQATGNPPFAIVASTTSQLPLSFTSSNTAVATVSGNQITILTPGTTTITATQTGDDNYNAATPVDRTLVVKPGQKITFDALTEKVLGDPSFAVSATASSGLPVTFASSNPGVASVSGSVITINGVGSTIIIASQPGDGTIVKAQDVGRILTVRNVVQTADQQGEIWGITRDNGTAGLGTVFKTNADGTGYSVVKEFKSDLNGAFPDGTLTLASNGKLYGITREGGSKNGGVLFEYDITSATYIKKFEFAAFTYPSKELVATTNGKLYGTTPYGLEDHTGSFIYEYDIATNSISQRTNFTGVGTYPNSNIVLNGSKIYGTVYSDFNYKKSAFFEYDIATGAVVKKAEFEAVDGGASTKGIALATNGKIYGTSEGDGVNGSGALFEFDITNNVVTKKYDFDYYPHGSRPVGLMSASNGKLYGMTKEGGLYAQGTIYEYDPTSSNYAKKYDFTINYVNPEGRPWGRLIEAPNGKFYGSGTPSTPGGSIFEFDLAAGTVAPKVYQTFSNGHAIFGSLCLANNKLYGLASQGGANNAGVLFEYNFADGTYAKRVEFSYAPDGVKPVGGLTLATNGKLYGLTLLGGNNNYGVVFEIDPTTNSYTKRADIEIALGNYLEPGLTLGLNGKLYGSTTAGSQYNAGAIFEFDPVTFQLKKLRSLDYPTGSTSRSRLVQTEDQKLWGLASTGGSNSIGTVFDVDVATGVLTKHADFLGADGSTPLGGLVLASNGKFYGHASKGGANNVGVIFEFDRTTSTKTVKYDFTSATGDGPIGAMIEVNKKLYGVTYQGGVNNAGVLFEYDPLANSYAKKYEFSYATGSNPKGGLLLAANGKIYGLVSSGGSNSRGGLFELDLTTNTYTLRQPFDNYNSTGQEIAMLTQTLKSTKKQQTISFDAIAAHVVGDAAFSIKATSSSSLAVKFSTASDKITLTDASVTIVKAGKVTINANQAGNGDYAAAPQVQQTFCINPAKPTVTVTNENSDNVKLNSSATTGNQWFLNGTAITDAKDATYSVKEAGVYAVQTSVDGCVSELSTNFPVIITGDSSSQVATSLLFYPNPANDKLMISLPDNTGSQINIYQMDGRSVKALAAGGSLVEVDVSNFMAGAYVVHINTNSSKNYVGKFIKK